MENVVRQLIFVPFTQKGCRLHRGVFYYFLRRDIILLKIGTRLENHAKISF